MISKSGNIGNHLIAAEAWLERAALYIGIIAMAAMMFLVAVDVVLRHAANKPLLITYDAVALLMVFLIASVIPYVQSKRGHIAIDFVMQKLSLKVRIALDIVALMIGLLFFVAVTYSSANYAWQSWIQKEFSEGIVPLPMYPARFALLAGIALMDLRLIIDILRQIAILTGRGPKEPLEGKSSEEVGV